MGIIRLDRSRPGRRIALHGFFNLSTWLTAIAGPAVLLLIFHLATGKSGRSRRST
jgi:hypothetical protein